MRQTDSTAPGPTVPRSWGRSACRAPGRFHRCHIAAPSHSQQVGGCLRYNCRASRTHQTRSCRSANCRSSRWHSRRRWEAARPRRPWKKQCRPASHNVGPTHCRPNRWSLASRTQPLQCPAGIRPCCRSSPHRCRSCTARGTRRCPRPVREEPPRPTQPAWTWASTKAHAPPVWVTERGAGFASTQEMLLSPSSLHLRARERRRRPSQGDRRARGSRCRPRHPCGSGP